MRPREGFFSPPVERDWRGREEPPTLIFGFRIVKGMAGEAEGRLARLMELIARVGAANRDNLLYEHLVDVRMVVTPDQAQGWGQGRVRWYLLVRVSVHGGTEAALERAAMERQTQIATLLDFFLPECVFAALSTAEVREALEPFKVADVVTLRRGREYWCGGAMPEEFPGVLDGDRLAEELLRYEEPSVISVRFQAVGVSERDILLGQREVYASAVEAGNRCVGCGGSFCVQQARLMLFAVVDKLESLRSGAFKVCIDLASAGEVREPAMRMLERAAGNPHGQGAGADAELVGELPSACECLRPRTRRAQGAVVSERALAERNLARIQQTRWDDLEGARLENRVLALAELANCEEAARLSFLPGRAVSRG